MLAEPELPLSYYVFDTVFRDIGQKAETNTEEKQSRLYPTSLFTSRLLNWIFKKWADLEYFFPFNTQLYVSGSQLALDLFGGSPVRHIDFDENLLHSLVPGAPGCLARDHATPLLKMHWHAAESPRRTGQLTVSYMASGEVMLTVWCAGTSSPPFT